MEAEMNLVLTVLAIVAILWLVYTLVTQHWKNIVIQTSDRYRALLLLNEKYNIDFSVQFEYKERVKTKQQFDNFNFHRNLHKKMEHNMNKYAAAIRNTESNQQLFQEYQKELENLPSFVTEAEAKERKVPYRSYLSIEEKILSENTKEFTALPMVIYQVSYISPKGRNAYEKHMHYFLEDIIGHQQYMKNYLEKKATKEYQRQKMTLSLRYDVMKRDNFHCVLCGRSEADGVTLHVDHIMPVAKGGKTEMTNLRTLCNECNMGKSDKYDAVGVN